MKRSKKASPDTLHKLIRNSRTDQLLVTQAKYSQDVKTMIALWNSREFFKASQLAEKVHSHIALAIQGSYALLSHWDIATFHHKMKQAHAFESYDDAVILLEADMTAFYLKNFRAANALLERRNSLFHFTDQSVLREWLYLRLEICSVTDQVKKDELQKKWQGVNRKIQKHNGLYRFDEQAAKLMKLYRNADASVLFLFFLNFIDLSEVACSQTVAWYKYYLETQHANKSCPRMVFFLAEYFIWLRRFERWYNILMTQVGLCCKRNYRK